MSADWRVTPPPRPFVEVLGGGRFPVRRIFCVGRNYAAHAREMGGDPEREPPFFFTKPADAVTHAPVVPYPPRTADLHHEVELVAAIGRGGQGIPVTSALDHVFGYAVGVDLTRRDLQAEAKKAGRPWDVAKGFDASAPISPLRVVESDAHPAAGRIELSVNGELRQVGDLGDLIWSVAEVVAELSTLFRLEAGDLVFTGTPEGVGAVARGDEVRCRIEGVGELSFTLGP